METVTDKKQISLNALIFNAAGEVLVVNSAQESEDGSHDNVQGLPGMQVDYDIDPGQIIKRLTGQIKNLIGVNCGVGDLVFDNYATDGTRVLMFMSFLEEYDALDNVDWVRLQDIKYGSDEKLMGDLKLHLQNTLFNPQVMQAGNCYENLITGEAYYVIHIINDTMRQKNFLVLESTMSDEPMVLPSDSFWGLTMKWVPHLRFMEILQYVPQTIAERAKYFFIKAHNMTNHRYNGKPYSFHLALVVEEFKKYKHLLPFTVVDRVEAELWGHDGIEDARLTWNDVNKALDSEEVAEGCYSMTNEKGRNRDQRANDAYYAGLAADPYGEFKKLCDRLANVRNAIATGHSMGGGYKKELTGFKSKLNTRGDAYKEMWDDLEQLLGN